MGTKNMDHGFATMADGAFDAIGKSVSQTMADRIVYLALCRASADVDELPVHQYEDEDIDGCMTLQPHNDFVPLPPRCFAGNSTDITAMISKNDIRQQVRASLNRLHDAGLIDTFRLPHTFHTYMYVLKIEDEHTDAVNEAVNAWRSDKYKPCMWDDVNEGWHLDVGEIYRMIYRPTEEIRNEIDLRLLRLRRELTFEGWRYLIK